MGYVIYETESGTGVRYVNKEPTAKGMVTKNNKELMWESLKGHTFRKVWSYCSWAEFESVATSSRKTGYHCWHKL